MIVYGLSGLGAAERGSKKRDHLQAFVIVKKINVLGRHYGYKCVVSETLFADVTDAQDDEVYRWVVCELARGRYESLVLTKESSLIRGLR